MMTSDPSSLKKF